MTNNVLLDINWTSALTLPTKVVLGLLIASVTLLVLEYKEVLDLAEFGSLAKPSTVVLTVVSAALSFTGIDAFFIEQWFVARR